MELNNILSPLAVIQSQINELMEHRSSLISSVEQRLKWASGANPSVVEVYIIEYISIVRLLNMICNRVVNYNNIFFVNIYTLGGS